MHHYKKVAIEYLGLDVFSFLQKKTSITVTESRHTIVCRAAQEAGKPHREYIDRKKENVIFTHLYLGDTSSDWN